MGARRGTGKFSKSPIKLSLIQTLEL
jgi:hypothetical protein